MNFRIRTEDNREAIISYIKRLPLDKRGFKALITPITKQRSNRQNAYAHYVFNLIAEECGETLEDVKWYYRKLFLTTVKRVFGEEVEYIKSTTELDTIQQEIS